MAKRPHRTRFGRDIVAEFLPPSRASHKAMIVLAGMPGSNSKDELLHFLSRKNYWAIFPRYRGSWESGGKFLARSPHEDVLEVIDELSKGITDLVNDRRYRLSLREVHLLGASFGGPAAILASRDKRVKKAVAFSSVIDWRKDKDEPLAWLEKFTRSAFGEAYRFSHRDWLKLKAGRFYSPWVERKNIDGKKLFLIHAKDDSIVPWQPTEAFAKAVKAQALIISHGDHLSSSNFMKPRFYKPISKFLFAK